MTKEELIKSYEALNTPVYTPVPAWSWIVLGMGIVTFVLAVVYALKRNDDGPEDSKTVVVVLSIVATIVLAVGGISVAAHSSPKKADFLDQLKWRQEVFKDQYVKNLPVEEIKVAEYTLDKEGISVILDTDKEITVVKDIETVRYEDNVEPHVKTKWVEKIEEINEGPIYYEPVLYLPREQ